MRRWQLVVFLAWVGFVAWGLSTGRLRTDSLSSAPDAGVPLAVTAAPEPIAPHRTPFPPASPEAPASPDKATEVPVLTATEPASTDGGASAEVTSEVVTATPPADAGADVLAMLGVADDGTALEVFPIPVVNRRDAGDDDDHTVIWQDDSGLISVRRSKKTLRELARLPRATPPSHAEKDLCARARQAMAAGRYDEARFAASHARGWMPDSPEPWLLLAEIARKQSDVAEAQYNYEQAKRRGGRIVGGYEDRLGREAKSIGTLSRSETAHATIAAPFELHEPTRLALHEQVEKAWAHVRQQLGFEPPGKVTVVLFRDEEFSQREGAVLWASGDYDGRVRLTASAAGSARGTSTLIHELTHHFVTTHGLGAVPAWFNEGVAQHVTQLAVGDAPIHCGGGHGFPLTELVNGFGRMESSREAGVAYVTAFHAVQRLAERTPLSTALPRMTGPGFASAFQQGFGEPLDGFVKRFDDEGPQD